MNQFIELVKTGDLPALKVLLTSDVFDLSEINKLDEDGRTPFELSLACGYKSIAELLMTQESFQMNSSNSNPLLATIKYGYIDLADRLLDKGANPNFRVVGSHSALVSMLEQEHFGLAKKMVECGAEINIRNEKGWTPLIWASIRGFKNIVIFLLDQGADVHIVNNDGWNAITGAIFKNHQDIVALLMEKGAVFSQKFAEAALVKSYQSGDKQSVDALMNLQINTNVFDEHKKPLLLMAIEKGDTEFIKKLLEQGANPNTLDASGASMLWHCAKLGALDNAKLLFENGADINLKNTSNEATALIKAAQDNQLVITAFLLEKDAYVDSQDKNGETAILYAVVEKNIELVNLLIQFKANANIKNIKGTSAISYASSQTSKFGIIAPYDKMLVIMRQNG